MSVPLYPAINMEHIIKTEVIHTQDVASHGFDGFYSEQNELQIKREADAGYGCENEQMEDLCGSGDEVKTETKDELEMKYESDTEEEDVIKKDYATEMKDLPKNDGELEGGNNDHDSFKNVDDTNNTQSGQISSKKDQN